MVVGHLHDARTDRTDRQRSTMTSPGICPPSDTQAAILRVLPVSPEPHRRTRRGELTESKNLSHLRANRIILARRINEIACRMVDLRTELKTLDEEMKTKAHQLHEVERILGADNISALRARMFADMSRHPSARSTHGQMIETNDQ